MLNQVDLRLFKCFELLRLPLAPLTLLSGGNACGKSSVLQALVLLHQTIREHEWSTRLMLNGASVCAGTVADLVDKINGRYSFRIAVMDDDRWYEWEFAGERAEMSMGVTAVTAGGQTYQEPQVLRYLLPPPVADAAGSLPQRLRGLTYITAERMGPREVYPLVDRQGAAVVGPAGEHAASVLYQGRDEDVIPALALPGVPATKLRQVQERMCTFFPGCGLALQPVPQANAVTLGLRNSSDTDYHRPVHAGFGLTQVLPIIVAALSAAQGDILLIENPEVHLHPSGQACMGQFLADVASAGVQVIAETHSDHILNGIRRSVKAGRIPADHVTIPFFRPRSADSPQVVTPILDSSGNLDLWPGGFFDQFDKDMNYFAGWGE